MVINKMLLAFIICIFIFKNTNAQGGWEKNYSGRWVYVMKSTSPQTYTPKPPPPAEPVKKTIVITETKIEKFPLRKKR